MGAMDELSTLVLPPLTHPFWLLVNKPLTILFLPTTLATPVKRLSLLKNNLWVPPQKIEVFEKVRKKKKPHDLWGFFDKIKLNSRKIIKKLEVRDDVTEYVTNNRTKHEQNSDNNDGDQDQNQSILYQTLTFFTR
jgi:hypothetical protein